MGILLRNWHLKLSAIALATVLYTGLVFSGSFSEQELGGIPVETLNQPADSVVMGGLPVDVRVRYRVSAESAGRVGTDSFLARIDLSDYDMERAGDPQSLAIEVRAVADDVTPLDWEPRQATVTLDRYGVKRVPVEVDPGEQPAGLETGRPRASVDEVEAQGPQSRLRRVDRALARIRIDPSGIDVRTSAELLAVDLEGRLVDGIELRPATVTVQLDVDPVETSKTVSVRPVLEGAAAPGFTLGALSVDPPTVTLDGPPALLAEIADVPTEPLSVADATQAVTGEVALVLPDGVTVAGGDGSATVGVEVVAVDAARTILAAVRCSAAPEGTACLPQTGQVPVTVRGPAPIVNALDAGAVTASVGAADLEPGEHDLAPTIAGLPETVQLVPDSVGPVRVTVQPLAASPSPGAPSPTQGG